MDEIVKLNREQRRKLRRTQEWKATYKELESKLLETCKTINAEGGNEDGTKRNTLSSNAEIID